MNLGEGIRVHPTADIDPSVDLGPGTVVWAYAILLGGVKTGPSCSIGAGTQLMHGVRLGESCRIGAQVFLSGHVQLGDRVFVGPQAAFADDRHPRVNNPQYRSDPGQAEDDVAVGMGATILPGVCLGRGCLIGAGAVVTQSVPPFETWVGTPAKALRRRGQDPQTGEWIASTVQMAAR